MQTRISYEQDCGRIHCTNELAKRLQDVVLIIDEQDAERARTQGVPQPHFVRMPTAGPSVQSLTVKLWQENGCPTLRLRLQFAIQGRDFRAGYLPPNFKFTVE